jgi:hypothetical protein
VNETDVSAASAIATASVEGRADGIPGCANDTTDVSARGGIVCWKATVGSVRVLVRAAVTAGTSSTTGVRTVSTGAHTVSTPLVGNSTDGEIRPISSFATLVTAVCSLAGGVKPSHVIGIPQNEQGCVPYSMIFPHFGQAKASTVSAM